MHKTRDGTYCYQCHVVLPWPPRARASSCPSPANLPKEPRTTPDAAYKLGQGRRAENIKRLIWQNYVSTPLGRTFDRALHRLAQSPLWGQCGGQGWTGATTCVAGATCTYSNPWYSQCLPGSASSSTTATSTTTTTTSGSSTSTSSAPGSTSTTGLTLRLLPLGDSITYGVQSSDGTGYRNTLHKLLEPGNTVDFIGSVKAGTMTDNDNEGHSGWTIDQIAGAANYSQAMPSKPNVVALHAGTNDIYGGNFGTAINRLTTLVDNLTLGYPSTVLLLSTIIPYPASQSSVDQFNTNITNLVTNRAAAGRKIVLASMSSVLSSDLADGVHPNDNGYKKMANAWYAAFATAAQKGWIVAPQ